jgi:hypothetical protein
MASSLLDVCRFNPTAGGTTDWTYSSAVQGYQSLSAAGAVNGATYSYRAESADLSQWEIGTGVYNSGTGVLTRAAVLFNSSGTTSKIDFSAAPQVAIVALAEDLHSNTAWTTFTPSPSVSGVSAWTVNTAKYKQFGKVVFWEIDFTITTGTWTAGGVLSFNLPVTANSPGGASGWEFAAVGAGINFYINPSSLGVMSARCGSNLVSTSRFVASGVYESA